MGKRISSRNTSQRHGFEFEDIMRISGLFSRGTKVVLTGREAFDIPEECDGVFHLPTSVKTSGDSWIGLADAERFALINKPWRLLHGPWVPVERDGMSLKSYHVIHEMIITLGVMKSLLGRLTAETLLAWHKEIASYGSGKEAADQARERAREIVKEAKAFDAKVRLDFKIDDKDQRRLQLSVKLETLAGLLVGQPEYVTGSRRQAPHVIHERSFHQFPMPIEIISSSRTIDRSPGTDATSAPQIVFDLTAAPPAVASDAEACAADHSATGSGEPPDEEGCDVFAITVQPLRKDPPKRQEERERERRLKAVATTEQMPLF